MPPLGHRRGGGPRRHELNFLRLRRITNWSAPASAITAASATIVIQPAVPPEWPAIDLSDAGAKAATRGLAASATSCCAGGDVVVVSAGIVVAASTEEGVVEIGVVASELEEIGVETIGVVSLLTDGEPESSEPRSSTGGGGTSSVDACAPPTEKPSEPVPAAKPSNTGTSSCSDWFEHGSER